jgi:hypothetical protein
MPKKLEKHTHGQGLRLTITQADTTVDLVAQDAIFGHQVRVAQQRFLIDGPSDLCQ